MKLKESADAQVLFKGQLLKITDCLLELDVELAEKVVKGIVDKAITEAAQFAPNNDQKEDAIERQKEMGIDITERKEGQSFGREHWAFCGSANRRLVIK